MPLIRRAPRSFRQHLAWAMVDVLLDLALLGAACAWVLTHLRPHG